MTAYRSSVSGALLLTDPPEERSKLTGSLAEDVVCGPITRRKICIMIKHLIPYESKLNHSRAVFRSSTGYRQNHQ